MKISHVTQRRNLSNYDGGELKGYAKLRQDKRINASDDACWLLYDH